MPHRNPPDPGGPLRRITSTSVIIAFALVMTASVLGVMAWKALDAKKTTLASGSAESKTSPIRFPSTPPTPFSRSISRWPEWSTR